MLHVYSFEAIARLLSRVVVFKGGHGGGGGDTQENQSREKYWEILHAFYRDFVVSLLLHTRYSI